jgi:hypothetical protein
MGAVVDTDTRAIEALGTALAGSSRPLVVAAGTLGLTPGRLATEEDVHDPNQPSRRPSEEAALAMVSRGVRASVGLVVGLLSASFGKAVWCTHGVQDYANGVMSEHATTVDSV